MFFCIFMNNFFKQRIEKNDAINISYSDLCKKCNFNTVSFVNPEILKDGFTSEIAKIDSYQIELVNMNSKSFNK
ncbi:hypothetical protein BpHYR1_017777 [Brachionus plicatilis]|uniref:Uncharacterized protein n=1 Tax=Brachionus plicatilis TaxID=10195 RepID=A0A3M7QIV7_BRAPC|nr:hypothetical protein BpHYR1_017777 [Brachionus plicatilis]